MTGGEPAAAASGIPAPLDALGGVFVPIDPREKGTTRPRTPEHLHAPDDDVLEAYLEAGHNYGVACQNGLAVLDADEPDALRDVIDALPETAWQVSGSGSGEHYFLQVPSFDEDLKLYHPETDEHLGEVKGAAQSYVVGPGSIHPSGGRYGPLRGDTIATIAADELRELLEPFLRESTRSRTPELPHGVEQPGPGGVTGGTDGDADLDVHDVVSRARYPGGERREHPFHGSDTGANFMVDDGGDTFRCWRHDCTGNALHLVGIEQGIIDCGEWLPGGLDTDTWREIFAAAREAGYDLPEYDAGGVDHVPVLPDTPALQSSTSGWDWRHAGRDTTLTIDDARERTTAAIADAYESGDRVLVEALPTMGKSYGAVKAAAETDQPVTILTGRGRKEQYEQFRGWCDEHGLTSNILPSFTRDCDTANGEHGEDWADTVESWYDRGATPQAIHKWAEDVLGRPLPCQAHDGQECPYTSEWRAAYEDPNGDPYDVLIGHYTHAHNQKVTEGRVCVFDEFPGNAYETQLGADLQRAVSYWLSTVDGVPFEDYTDLVEHRHDDDRRADALLWFEDHDLETDETHVFDDDAAHAAAPLAVFTLLASDDLGNGFETAALDDAGTGVFNRASGAVALLRPPALESASGVVALDGTPTPEMWELALGERLNHRQVLQPAERTEYVRDALNLNLVRTTDAVKPYNSADHVAVDQDAALLESITETHGERPALITTATAKGTERMTGEYEKAGILELDEDGRVVDGLVRAAKHYGDVLGSNEFDDTRVGAVIGSNHYGDGYIKKWGAFAGEPVERNSEKGAGLSYGRFGDDVLTHMREHDTLQAAMRFGRDGNGAVVYVHTDTLPEWVPLAGEGRVVTTWSDGMRGVLQALDGLGDATTAEVAAHPAVDCSHRQVFNHLETLRERGVLEREQDPEDGRRVRWRDDGLHRVNEHGDVELEPVELAALDDDEVAELARSSIYTGDFRNTPLDRLASPSSEGGSGPAAVSDAAAGGGPVVNDAD